MTTIRRYITMLSFKMKRHRKGILCTLGVLLIIFIHRYLNSESFLIQEFRLTLPTPKNPLMQVTTSEDLANNRVPVTTSEELATTQLPVSDPKGSTGKVQYLSEKEAQRYINYMAEYVTVNVTVISNRAETNYKKISLFNRGKLKIPKFIWSIYFYDINFVGSSRRPYPLGLRLDNSELLIFHEAGNLYRLQPSNKFPKYIYPGDTIEAEYDAYGPHVSRFFTFPNWFVSCLTCEPRLLTCTQSERLDFVGKLTKPQQVKRSEDDRVKMFTVQDRFKRNSAIVNALKPPINAILPTPLSVEGREDDSILVSTHWSVSAKNFQKEARIFAGFLQLDVKKREAGTSVITFTQKNISLPSNVRLSKNEAYEILIDPESDSIQVSANADVGAFYAIQTLLSIQKKEYDKLGNLIGYRFPKIKVTDAPRFEYRGVMLDVSRNFVSKKTVLKLLDLMAMYKVNKFHFHLTDDDGWRLEIRSYPELTEFASNRCMDKSNEVCLPPSLGSGPYSNTSGSGYYSVEDYKEILRYAKDRHIQVIPELDVPGHSRSAVQAMELRYRKTKDPRYHLTDPDDKSKYFSAQAHSDNAVNPCIDSTYDFFKTVLLDLHDMHKDIQPMTFYMLGGDEVARGAWEKSPVCEKFKAEKNLRDYYDLKKYFFKRLITELKMEGMKVGLWEDAVLDGNLEPQNPMEQSQVGQLYIYSWTNIWEWRRGSLAYKLANAGFQVVMSPATCLYFDHPYEPDPEERGLYWATRYIDTRTTFNYQPDNIYWNRGTRHNGAEMSDAILCSGGCPPLKAPENIRGIQADLWTETIRTPDQLDYMLFPRLLALAERAWHKAPWENIKVEARRKLKQQTDWEVFANKVGHKELRRLEEMGVEYRLDPPGARLNNSILEVNTIFPGTPTEYSLDNGLTWKKHDTEISNTPKHKGKILVRSSSFDGKRKSRIVSLEGL